MTESAHTPKPASTAESSARIARAKAGDRESFTWLVARYGPMIEVQADYRIGLIPGLRRYVAPEDVVQQVWLGVLRNFGSFEPPPTNASRAWMGYLSTAVLRTLNQAVEKHLRGKPKRVASAGGADESTRCDVIGGVAASETGPATAVANRDADNHVHRTLASTLAALDPLDRNVIVLAAIEQQPHAAVARELGISADASRQRLRRGLARLRQVLPDSIFDEAGLAPD